MSVSSISATNQTYPSAVPVSSSGCQLDLQNPATNPQSGNTAGAQQSFSQVMHNTLSGGSSSTSQSHGHHHHHHKAASRAQGSSTQSTQDTSPSNSSSLAQNLLSVPVSGMLPADTALTGNI